MTHAILFDLDGVLVRTEDVWFHVLEEAGVRFRGRPVTREEFAPTFGQGTRADAQSFGLGCTPEELDAFYVQAFPRHLDNVWVHPQAEGLLRRLRQRGLRLALVTNSATELARKVVSQAGLLQHLQFLSCADQVSAAKPAPDVVLHALQNLNVQADEAWMVGDSRFDRGAADAAGVHFVGLAIDGDQRIEDLVELEELL